MTSLIAKYISKKVLGESLQNNFGKEDPYFESVPSTRLNGKPSKKMKKVRKALPPGLSEHDGKVLTKVKRRAYRLDMSLFNCCGIRFGWSSVIGIIPVIGDFIDAFMAVMVLRTCEQIEGGLPAGVRSQMYVNIMLDFGIGLVPFLGDIADALFRANTRNAVVLEKHLRTKGAKALKAQGQPHPPIDPSDPEEYDRWEQENSPPEYAAGAHTQEGTHRHDISSGQTAQRPVTGQPARGGLFSGFGSKTRQPDVERGTTSRRDDPLPHLPNDDIRQDPATLQKTRR